MEKKAAPDVFGSIVNTLKYKNFNLRVMANYTIGGYGFSSFGRNVTSDGLNIMNETNQSINWIDGKILEISHCLQGHFGVLAHSQL